MKFYYALLVSYIFILCNLKAYHGQDLKSCGFDAIYQFGDSISDTGNAASQLNKGAIKYPFGITIKNQTGRFSDGYLMIDFFAQAAGLQTNPPYENPKSDLSHGANFAFAGATALSTETLLKMNVTSAMIKLSNNSLLIQLDWFKKLMATKCPIKKDCPEKLKKSLFIIGEIGVNDYWPAIYQNHTIEDVKKMMVPEEIKVISHVIREVISYGAVYVAVPGQFLLGCSPGFFTKFEFDTTAAKDKHGCLKDFNDLFMYHNIQLQVAIVEIQKEFPNVHIVYGDIYRAFTWILDNLHELGFKTFQQCCCGSGGKFNVGPKSCGDPGVPICSNPLDRVYWDAGHFSHQTNKYMAEWLLKDMVPKMKCTS